MTTNKELLNEYKQASLLQKFGMAERLVVALEQTNLDYLYYREYCEELEDRLKEEFDISTSNDNVREWFENKCQELQTTIRNLEEELAQLKLDTMPLLTNIEINGMNGFGCVPPQTQQTNQSVPRAQQVEDVRAMEVLDTAINAEVDRELTNKLLKYLDQTTPFFQGATGGTLGAAFEGIRMALDMSGQVGANKEYPIDDMLKCALDAMEAGNWGWGEYYTSSARKMIKGCWNRKAVHSTLEDGLKSAKEDVASGRPLQSWGDFTRFANDCLDEQPTDLSSMGGYLKEIKQHIQVVQQLTDKLVEEYNLPFTD